MRRNEGRGRKEERNIERTGMMDKWTDGQVEGTRTDGITDGKREGQRQTDRGSEGLGP